MIVFNDTASDIFDGGDGRGTLSISNGATPAASPTRAGSRSGRRRAVPLSASPGTAAHIVTLQPDGPVTLAAGDLVL